MSRLGGVTVEGGWGAGCVRGPYSGGKAMEIRSDVSEMDGEMVEGVGKRRG